MSGEKVTTEQAILIAAEEVFLEKGYAAAKTTEIAKRAGVNHAMLHYYFRTKVSLFDKIFEEKSRLLTDSFFSVFEMDLPFTEKVRLAVGKHYDFLVQNPQLPMFIMGEVLRDTERKEQIRKILKPKLIRLTHDMQKEIDKEVKNGTIKPSLAVDSILNAISLNVFSIVFMQLTAEGDNYWDGTKIQALLKHRRANNIELVMKGLGIF